MARRNVEQAANDGLGNYLLPTLRGIEVQELSREEFEALLNGQTEAV